MASDAHSSEEGGPQQGRPTEVRLPALLALLVAGGLYATLPSGLLAGPRLVIPAVEAVLLVPLLLVNPYRLTRRDRRLRMLSIALTLVVALSNTVAFALLVHALLHGAKQGSTLLVAAGQVWATNVIAYALIYWETDRGGPVSRHQLDRGDLPAADFRFSQDEDHDTVDEVRGRASVDSDWRPRFIDYLYVSLTNSSAFSPTDTMPLSPRVKLLMGAEATQALLISVLVIARGVSLLQ